MKKIKTKVLLAISTLSVLPIAYAGSIGPIAVDKKSILPFVSLDAAYTWNSMIPGVINDAQSTENGNGWGGRAAGGFALQYTDDIRLSTEFGWGSYGYSNFQDVSVGETYTRWDINGFDILLGAIYNYKKLDFYAKAGALFQNLEMTKEQNLALAIPGGFVSGHNADSRTNSGVLPELKVGVEYNINDHLGAGVSYMYAFGANRTIYTDSAATTSGISLSNQYRLQAPTINSIMFGLHYYL